MDIRTRVSRTIGKYRMIVPGQTVLVAVSGGPDSMALLHVLYDLRSDLGCRLAVVHFNHLTRGAESDGDEEMVRQAAGALDLPCWVGRGDVPGVVRPGLSLQVAAREIRYRFFEETAARAGAARVALGHQADDQAETVLQNILRGCGTTGLAGIPPCRGIFVRPLLAIRRAEIMSYLENGDRPYRIDASNLKPVYSRNRVRLELIPHLVSGYNPRVVESLNHLAALAREDEEYIGEKARAVFECVGSRTDAGEVALDLAGLSSLPGALAGRVIRIAWERLTRRPRDLSYAHVRAVRALAAEGAAGAALALPGGVRVVRTYTHVLLGPDRPRTNPLPPRPLAVPGRTAVPEAGWALWADLPATPPAWRRLPRTEAVVDYDRTGGELFVRGRMRGDLFWPLGLPGRIKLKKYFIDRKVPRAERDRVPLVGTREGIVWVAGHAPGHPYRVTEDTRSFLHLRLERLPGQEEAGQDVCQQIIPVL